MKDWATLAHMIFTRVNNPTDLRSLSLEELKQLSAEVARFMLTNTGEKEGHMISSLAVTELTLALHYSFNTPTDILIWDVGHQAYIHKILTDRKATFHTNRKQGGISGFTSRSESRYDPFGAGHSSTSISAIGGFAQAAMQRNIRRKHIAVIGDGALTGGMAYEALNHLGTSDLDILLVLNDNEESIDQSVGALHEFQSYQTFFESLGWGYSGPVDGHNIALLTKHFKREKHNTGTRVLHVKTRKKALATWREELKIPAAKSQISHRDNYQDIFADKLIELAQRDDRIVAITPAMLGGSSLHRFQSRYPHRTFDTGINEQHAVTFAAGLAASGMKPLVHLYSTFAQRAYDQIIHDVALQRLPVVFALDRAGLVGEDGATHHGAFDLSFLNPIPNLQILAPMTGAELQRMLAYAFTQNGPVTIRYPRGNEKPFDGDPQKLESGSFRVLKTGEKICVVSLGTVGVHVEQAIVNLECHDIGHIDLRFLKPWNDAQLADVLAHYSTIVTAEEGSMRGGLRDSMAGWLAVHHPEKKLIGIGLPDAFIGHGKPGELENQTGLGLRDIELLLRELLRSHSF
jgi:1-deoxy-D-xylulose-5-phosphate synthase